LSEGSHRKHIKNLLKKHQELLENTLKSVWNL